MFDDADRTRRTDRPTEPRFVDYAVIAAMLLATSVATYRLFDDRAAGPMAEAVPVEAIVPGAGDVVVR